MKIINAGEIDAYQKVFTQLADTAVYGAEARTVITGVLNELDA